MFTHIVLGSNDLERSRAFYDAALGALGAAPGMTVPSPAGGTRLLYRHNGGMLIVGQPIDGEPATHANGGTVGLAASSAEQVDAWHDAGVAAGGTSCEDPPGLREVAGSKLYLAYLRDPEGNKLCAMVPMG